jgi:hypothetical protein
MTARELFPVKFYKPGENSPVTKDFRPIAIPATVPEPTPKAKAPRLVGELVTATDQIQPPAEVPSSHSGDSSNPADSTGSATPPAAVTLQPPIK